MTIDGDAARAEREAVRLARETPSGTVVLVDAADAPSSGASGDSNAILRALVEGGYDRRVLLPMVDPPAVTAAVAAGVGETVFPLDPAVPFAPRPALFRHG